MARQRRPQDTGGPMTPAHLAQLNRLIESCQETARYCDQCSAAGLDVGPEARKNAEQMEVAMKMKRVFFPESK